MKAVISTYHQCVKIPIPWGIIKITGDRGKRFYAIELKPSKTPEEAQQSRQKALEVLEAREHDVKEVPISPEDPEAKVFIGSSLPEQIEEYLVEFLKSRKNTFAWKPEDMTGINKNITTHKLDVDPSFRSIHQKRRKFTPERNQIIQEEVERLLEIDMIREVHFPRWLANVVVIQKKNGKWRVCVDFTDLNKACPKDPSPLPHIDSMINAVADHEMLTFMDASSGFHQIQMEPSD